MFGQFYRQNAFTNSKGCAKTVVIGSLRTCYTIIQCLDRAVGSQ
jgi:hypothetical protein